MLQGPRAEDQPYFGTGVEIAHKDVRVSTNPWQTLKCVPGLPTAFHGAPGLGINHQPLQPS